MAESTGFPAFVSEKEALFAQDVSISIIEKQLTCISLIYARSTGFIRDK